MSFTAPRMAFVVFASMALSACEQNSFVPPPPPKVEVAVPLQRPITRYLEATGNTAPIKNVDLVARVQGVLQAINYQDGTFVKEGTTLFTIEPETYKLKLEQAQAAEAGAQASVKQAESDFKRQADLVQKQAVSQATLDTSTSTRDNAQANLQQAQANTKIAAVNLRLHQRRRAVRRHRQRPSGLDRRTGRRGVADPACHHRRARSDLCEFQRQRTGRAADPRGGKAARHDDQRTQAVAGRGRVADRERLSAQGQARLHLAEPQPVDRNAGRARLLPNPDRVLLPGFFVRVRVPFDEQKDALLVPDVALGSDQAGRYVLVVNGDNVVEQRKVLTGPLDGDLRVIETGLKPDDRVVTTGLLRAIPGQKVDPQLKTIEASPAAKK